MEAEENKIVKFFETLNAIPLPSWVKNNIITALGKGVGQIITSGLDWPTAWFEMKSRELRSRAAGNEAVQKEASAQVAYLFKTESKLADRAISYYAEKLIEKQVNREDVTYNFIQEVAHQSVGEASPNFINEDWLNTFWELAETKSATEVKYILGKILTKEVTSPKSVSPITLQMISVLTSDIGDAFRKLCNISINTGSFVFVIHPNIGPFMTCGDLLDYGISFDEQAELEGIGLIRSIHVTPLNISPEVGDFDTCDYAGVEAKMNFSSGVKIIDFTRAGRELRNLLDLEPNKKYMEFLLGFGADKFQLQ